MIKRKYLGLLGAAVLTAATVCSVQAYTPGTYTGEADGFGGSVIVDITVDEASVTEVSITGDSETPEVGGAALEELASQILAAGSAEIDGVAGATLTTDGVKTAAAIAFGAAAGEEGEAAEEAPAADASSVSGTFAGSSVGMQGPVTVTLTVENGTIAAAELTECSETPAVCSVAMERIPAQIVEYQTTEVDTVTGATLCSNAIMRAANAAAKEAGLDLEALAANAYHAQPGEDEVYDTDIVVVGAGGAGFSAAITAAQEGASVIMLEKSSVCGGNTLMQGGAFNANDPEAQALKVMSPAERKAIDGYLALSADDESLHFADFPEWEQVLTDLQADINAFLEANEGKEPGVDMPGYDSVYLHMWHIYIGGLRELADGTWTASKIDLATTLAENALETYKWCVDSLAIEGAYGEDLGDGLYTVLGAMWPRTHRFMTSTPLIDTLKVKTDELGVQIYTETAAKSLIADENGAIVGVEAEKADGTKVTVNAKAVVLACGGYGANAPMAKAYDNYWGDNLSDTTLTTNVGTNTGDGIEMATAVGADTTGLDVVQLMPSSSPIKGTMTDGVWADASAQIWIDKDGNRFVDEYAERDVLASASLALEDGIFYIIYAGTVDETTGMCEGCDFTANQFGTTIETMVNNGHIWYGSTLAELAEASATTAGGACPAFTEEALRNTIEKYNSYVDAQEDPDFGKAVISGKIDLEAIEANPEVGICISPRKASIHHTMGGVSINTAAEVISTEGTAIPGLFAAGEVTGGIHAGNRLGGNAVADIFTFGHIAGASAAAYTK